LFFWGFIATEVVLLRKLGKNKVGFQIHSTKEVEKQIFH
jgi:hypothetical protein